MSDNVEITPISWTVDVIRVTCPVCGGDVYTKEIAKAVTDPVTNELLSCPECATVYILNTTPVVSLVNGEFVDGGSPISAKFTDDNLVYQPLDSAKCKPHGKGIVGRMDKSSFVFTGGCAVCEEEGKVASYLIRIILETKLYSVEVIR